MKNKDYKGEYISMRKLNTIQKVENLNNVFADDNSDLVGGAAHHYAVKRLGLMNIEILHVLISNAEQGMISIQKKGFLTRTCWKLFGIG